MLINQMPPCALLQFWLFRLNTGCKRVLGNGDDDDGTHRIPENRCC